MRILKIVTLGLVGIIVLSGIAVGSALGYRTYRQHQNSEALGIHAVNGIEQGKFVDIGGLRQWIQIRGDDRNNPVILFVHGGPAMSMIPFTYRSMRPWEKDFTIVQWDQRGAGRTYVLNGGADETASGMDQIIDDGVRISEYARTLLHKDRIIVLGESFGSAVALEMARRRPDLFYAYVGTGQSVDTQRAGALTFQLLSERVRSEHDAKAIDQLGALGPPPYADASRMTLEQRLVADHPAASERAWGLDFLFVPGYSLRESFELLGGATQHRSKLLAEDLHYNAESRGKRFEVPVFFIQGSEDIQAPLQLAAEYMAAISAPRKALVVIKGGGHNAFIFYSQRFLAELDARVRPLALPAG
jgi:pimeloyl-ACP methyl ester carboxylesterase